MIESVEAFINYFEGVRRRTVTYISNTPPEHLDWSPREGEFTCRQLITHIVIAEKMFVGVFVSGRWKYDDSLALAGDMENVLTAFNAHHAETLQLLRGVPDSELKTQRKTFDGPELKAWRLLMMMVEHEIHHRSQLAMYQFLLGVKPPHIFGMGVEDVIGRMTG